MTMILPSTLLRRALVLDALASGGTGVLTAAGARILASFCNLPESLLIYSGLSLLPFAAIVGLLARRWRLPAGRAQFRCHPGLECGRRLPEGDCADGASD